MVGDPEERGDGTADTDGAAASSDAWSRLSDGRAQVPDADDAEVTDAVDAGDADAAGTSTAERPTAHVGEVDRDPVWRRALRWAVRPLRWVVRWAVRPLRPVGRFAGWVGRQLGRLNDRLDRLGRGLVDLAGRPWVLVVAVVNVMLLVAALTFVLGPDTAPNLPYVPVAGVDEVEEPVLDQDRDILFVPVDDEIHAYDASGPVPRYCARSGHLESEDGRVWSLRGEPLDGGPPLREHPVIVYDGTIYLDSSVTEPAAPTAPDQGAEPACR